MAGWRAWRDSPRDYVPPSGFGFVHRPDFPDRYVRERSDRGWQRCDWCGDEFKLWMTSFENWERLPPPLWSAFLCVPCYRKLARGV